MWQRSTQSNAYQGQYQNNGYKGNNYQGNRGVYHNPSRNFQQGNNYGQFRGRSCGHGRGNYCGHGRAGLIIEVMLTTNTISVMVMMMSTRQINMVHHVHYAVAITTLLNIVLRENTIPMIL